MSWLYWAIMGLIVGALAKFLVPGKDPGGFFTTMIIGIVGAFVGGFISSFLGFGTIEQMGIIGDLIFATVGAVILLIVYRMVRGGASSE